MSTLLLQCQVILRVKYGCIVDPRIIKLDIAIQAVSTTAIDESVSCSSMLHSNSDFRADLHQFPALI